MRKAFEKTGRQAKRISLRDQYPRKPPPDIRAISLTVFTCHRKTPTRSSCPPIPALINLRCVAYDQKRAVPFLLAHAVLRKQLLPSIFIVLGFILIYTFLGFLAYQGWPVVYPGLKPPVNTLCHDSFQSVNDGGQEGVEGSGWRLTGTPSVSQNWARI